MDIRILKLINAFENNGWELIGSVDISKDWWFEDIIQLDSNWRPLGKSVYLTLLTDPQLISKKIVWDIGISCSVQADRNFDFIASISLNDIKKTDLDLFVKKINKEVLYN